MKDLMKIFCTIFCLIVLVSAISASEGEKYIYVYSENDVTIEFSENTALSIEERARVADHIVYGTPDSQTYSLCWLLGHDITVDTVTATYHKKSQYTPRCLLEIYHVDVCSNCDYVYPRLVSSSYVACCPPEASAVSIDDSHTH